MKSKWFNLVTLAMGSLALFFAWRANEIASIQFKSNVVVLSTHRLGYDFDLTDPTVTRLGCMDRLRLANLGSVDNSITNYSTMVYYKNTISQFQGYGYGLNYYRFENPPSPRAPYTASIELRNTINRLDINIVQNMATFDQAPIHDSIPPIPFPLRVEANSSFDVEMTYVYGLLKPRQFNQFEEGIFLFPNAPKDMPPLEFEPIFTLATGDTIRGNKMQCFTVGP